MNKTIILSLDSFVKNDPSDQFSTSTLSYHLEHHHKQIDIPHKHNFYTTVIFTKGTGTHEIDFEIFNVSRGSIFMLHPGRTHYWKLSEDIEGFIFFHTENFYNQLFVQNTLPHYPFFASTKNTPCLQLNEQQTQEFISYFETLLQEYKGNHQLKNRKIHIFIDLIYIELTRLIEHQLKKNSPSPQHYSDRLIQLELLIDQHFVREKSPRKYAEWMNITPKHLNRITRMSVNKTTTQLITERLILEAKRMISNPNFQLAQIAEKLGFEDYSYFSKLFKKSTSQTPMEFKKKYEVDFTK